MALHDDIPAMFTMPVPWIHGIRYCQQALDAGFEKLGTSRLPGNYEYCYSLATRHELWDGMLTSTVALDQPYLPQYLRTLPQEKPIDSKFTIQFALACYGRAHKEVINKGTVAEVLALEDTANKVPTERIMAAFVSWLGYCGYNSGEVVKMVKKGPMPEEERAIMWRWYQAAVTEKVPIGAFLTMKDFTAWEEKERGKKSAAAKAAEGKTVPENKDKPARSIGPDDTAGMIGGIVENMHKQAATLFSGPVSFGDEVVAYTTSTAAPTPTPIISTS